MSVQNPTAAAAPRGARLRRLRLPAVLRSQPRPWTHEATMLTLLVAALVLLGLAMSLSASFVDAAERGSPFGIFLRQLLWAALGVPAFAIAAGMHHRLWRPLSWLMIVASLAGLVAVLTPLGLSEAGSTRWIAIGPIVLQPSELAKLATLLWLADVLARKREHGTELESRLSHLLIPALPLLLVLAVLVLFQPDLGTTLLLALIVALVLWANGMRLRNFVALGTVGVVLAAGLAVIEPYRFQRVLGWWRPEDDPLGNGYQLLQSLYALGSGGWFGLGLGSSRGKWNFVPNPETDFIFAIIGEELGLVGAALVLLMFLGLLVLGLRIARRAPDEFSRVVAIGVSGWTVGQALVNVGAVTGLLPITGVTLPLVSVGGSSLLSTMVALGILVSIARSTAATPAARPAVRPAARPAARGTSHRSSRS